MPLRHELLRIFHAEVIIAKAVPRATAGPKTMKYDVAFTLDPRHDFLPVEILITESVENITWPGWEQRWEIQEFRQTLDERTNENRWFPVSGILTQGKTSGSKVRMKVEKCRINPTIPLSLFRPEIPDGTSVSDVTADGHGKMTIKGGKFAIRQRIKSLTDQAHLAPRNPSRRWVILVAIGVLIVSILVLTLRQFRRSQLNRP